MATNIGLPDQPSDTELPFLLTQPLLEHLIVHYLFNWIEPLRIEHIAGRTPQAMLMLEKQ